jgi:hypothetical protein
VLHVNAALSRTTVRCNVKHPNPEELGETDEDRLVGVAEQLNCRLSALKSVEMGSMRYS